MRPGSSKTATTEPKKLEIKQPQLQERHVG